MRKHIAERNKYPKHFHFANGLTADARNNLKRRTMDQKTPLVNSNKISEHVLIESLHEIEHTGTDQFAHRSGEECEQEKFIRLYELNGQLRMRNALLIALKDKLISVQETVIQLQCLSDPAVNAAFKTREQINGELIVISDYTRMAIQSLDSTSGTVSGLVNQLLQSYHVSGNNGDH